MVNERVSAGISVGVALHSQLEDPEAFFARADAALYEAKREGGTRALSAQPSRTLWVSVRRAGSLAARDARRAGAGVSNCSSQGCGPGPAPTVAAL